MSEQDIYRAVLEGAGYERLDDLPLHPGGVAFARAVGEQARKRTLEYKDELAALRAENARRVQSESSQFKLRVEAELRADRAEAERDALRAQVERWEARFLKWEGVG